MTLQECLAQLPDPRRAQGRRDELTPLLIGTILAIACGAHLLSQGPLFLGGPLAAPHRGVRRDVKAGAGVYHSARASSTPVPWRRPFALTAAPCSRPMARARAAASPSTARCCGAASIPFADPRAAQLLGALA
jgi:hypothetical protein